MGNNKIKLEKNYTILSLEKVRKKLYHNILLNRTLWLKEKRAADFSVALSKSVQLKNLNLAQICLANHTDSSLLKHTFSFRHISTADNHIS